MKEVVFEYRCRRCSEIVTGASTERDNASVLLREAAMLYGTALIRKSNPLAPALVEIGHQCNDGGYGLMDLIGFRGGTVMCDCKIYEICPECAPSEEAYQKAVQAHNDAARQVEQDLKKAKHPNDLPDDDN